MWTGFKWFVVIKTLKWQHAWLLIDCRVDAGCTGVECYIFLFMFLACRNLAQHRRDISLFSNNLRRFLPNRIIWLKHVCAVCKTVNTTKEREKKKKKHCSIFRFSSVASARFREGVGVFINVSFQAKLFFDTEEDVTTFWKTQTVCETVVMLSHGFRDQTLMK